MAKHNGVTIRIGAAYDTVEVRGARTELLFDRADLNKRKAAGDREAKDALYSLRKNILDAFVVQQEMQNKCERKKFNRPTRKSHKQEYQHAA